MTACSLKSWSATVCGYLYILALRISSDNHLRRLIAKSPLDLRTQSLMSIIAQADRAQSAGMLLRQVCANQAEELKAYKEAFPTLCKDLTELRDEYQKREKELKLEIRAKLSLQAEVSKLRERVDSLSTDIKQVSFVFYHHQF